MADGPGCRWSPRATVWRANRARAAGSARGQRWSSGPACAPPQSMPQGPGARQLQHLMHAAARLDGAGPRQQMVGLEPQTPCPTCRPDVGNSGDSITPAVACSSGNRRQQQRNANPQKKPHTGGGGAYRPGRWSCRPPAAPGKHPPAAGVEPQTGFGPAQQGREGRIRGGQV